MGHRKKIKIQIVSERVRDLAEKFLADDLHQPGWRLRFRRFEDVMMEIVVEERLEERERAAGAVCFICHNLPVIFPREMNKEGDWFHKLPVEVVPCTASDIWNLPKPYSPAHMRIRLPKK